MRLLNKIFFLSVILSALLCVISTSAANLNNLEPTSIDRSQLVTEQINLLKNRLAQSQAELSDLQHEQEKNISLLAVNKPSRNLLEKANLDVSVAKSNLDSINIELMDCTQTITWLEKSIQEYNNQLNVLNIFGTRIAKNQPINIKELTDDLNYQKKLWDLEKNRSKYLTQLQTTATNILNIRTENFNQLNKLLKSGNLLQTKKQQISDELAYQQQQNYWLQNLNELYAKLAVIDPIKAQDNYTETERKIFIANENANYDYLQSLIARYKDQLQQMKFTVQRSNSISLLNDISDQLQAVTKQVARLDDVLKSRNSSLEKHINYLSDKKSNPQFNKYIQELSNIKMQYTASGSSINHIKTDLIEFRTTLDHEIQSELSSRQGFPTFDFRIWLDLGKEILLVPALTFEIAKNITTHVYNASQTRTTFEWGVFFCVQALLIFVFSFIYKITSQLLLRPSSWREKLNSKWLSLRWLKQNSIDLFLLSNIFFTLYYLKVPYQAFRVVIYLSFVWLIFKSIFIITRLSLIETTHDTTGHDVRLFNRLRWIIFIGGIITALTVYVHQLPMMFELKNLCDRFFLVCLMVVSLFLLRSWHVVPNLIMSHMEAPHPYLQKSISFIGVLIPLLIFGNSIVGVFGYLNLVMTISWYEGVFLIVLVGYLVLRGLMTDGVEQISRLTIRYVQNGWLLTEAFLKPFDKILRIFLFLSAGAVLFLLYGWDQQSPIVERIMRLLHYQLVNILNTTITPLNVIGLVVVISVFYWTAKWTREFVYRLLASRTKDMGVRNSIAILSQYSVVIVGAFLCLRVLGINLQALAFVAGMLAFGVGLGLRDLANNFACGFLILLERPLRVADIVEINGVEGEVTHIGSRAVTVRTNDHMELMVPNVEIFNKSFTNWTAKDNIVRCVSSIKINRFDNPHEVKIIIHGVLVANNDVLKDPGPEVYLKRVDETLLEFELRYYVNIRQVLSRTKVMSAVLMSIWDEFSKHGIKTPFPQREIFIRNEK